MRVRLILRHYAANFWPFPTGGGVMEHESGG
jgi:hypothetical protein